MTLSLLWHRIEFNWNQGMSDCGKGKSRQQWHKVQQRVLGKVKSVTDIKNADAFQYAYMTEPKDNELSFIVQEVKHSMFVLYYDP